MSQSSASALGFRESASLHSPSSRPHSGSHSAHFYSEDDSLITEVGQILAAALQAGGSAIIIADPSHRQSFARYLESRGVDLVRATGLGRWIALDASAALAEFMVDGWPDEQRFQMLIGGVLDRLTSTAAASATPPVAAYGEMVTVLWRRGKQAAALRLEELWCELGRSRAFHLSCGWPLSFFKDDRDALLVDKIGALHTHVLPGVGPNAMGGNPRAGLLWQIKANKVLQRVSSISRQTLGFYRDLSAPAWINVQDAIDEVLAMYEPKLRNREIAVLCKIHPNLKLFASLGEMKYILSKLMANAFDASFQGSTIYLAARSAHHPLTGTRGVRISVGDQGLGLEPKEAEQVFSPFFSSRKDISVGLGLWTLKDLLERRGGYIRCRSRAVAPSGTIMGAFLPTHPVAAAPGAQPSAA